jgi:hypothetical protein
MNPAFSALKRATVALALSGAIAIGCDGGVSPGMDGSDGAVRDGGVPGSGGGAGIGGGAAGAAGAAGIGGAAAGAAGSAGIGGGAAGAAAAAGIGGAVAGSGGVAGLGGAAGIAGGNAGSGGSAGIGGGNAGSGGSAGIGGGNAGSGGSAGFDGGTAGSGGAGFDGGGLVCDPAPMDDVWASLRFTNPPSTVEAIAPGEVWGTASNGKLLRFNGTDWTTMPAPFTWVATRALVRGSSANDLWLTDGATAVARWDGQAWTDVSPTGLPSGLTGSSITQLRVLGPSAAWLVSSYVVSAAPAPGNVNTSLPLRWDGANWNAVALPADAQPFPQIHGLWITAANDVWLGGQVVQPQGTTTTTSAIVLHWDGAGLVSVPYGPQPGSAGRSVWSVWASTANDVWIGGGSSVGATVDHFDGAAWTEVTFPRVYDYVEALWGWCTSNLWAATKYQGVFHFGGSGWTLTGSLQNVEPIEASGTGFSDVWISGSQNATFHWQPNSCGDLVVGPGEACDPPNGTSCDSNCQLIPIVCGNGIVQPGESCEWTNTQICQNCQQTSCGGCFVAVGGGKGVCDGLSAADSLACNQLVGCASYNMGWCVGVGTDATACYCGDQTCASGANGQCAAQFETLAHSTDPAVVRAQIADPSTPVGKVSKAITSFLHSSCGPICAGVVHP